ncbi:MAG: hypothetical protein B7O98_00940 [Zestosphaera tikiterensis]|uniref:ABC-2 type transporter domain-containing protein n=1 Tax=Zestosphaera tikiterensis TaxID=1973259 RepID=A0A2R7Y907_9CREN|nr:MAG: hypothetical protein B7O98_00940 [Zestosphaera tikiterensis]
MKFLRASKAVLKAYLTAELIRSKGLAFGLMSLAIWLSMFITPVTFFAESQAQAGTLSAGVLIGISVFLAYSTATWDWAWLLRWLLQLGVLEYVIASGSSIFTHYLGMVPVSIAWYSVALLIAYGVVSTFVAPPTIALVNPLLFLAGVASLLFVLLAYAMLLGGTIIGAGSAGPVVEFISWILPVATGGLTPLKSLPTVVQNIALATPFSYPAELIRYSLGVSNPILDPNLTALIGILYSTAFLAFSTAFMKYQLRKMLKEGVKSVAAF